MSQWKIHGIMDKKKKGSFKVYGVPDEKQHEYLPTEYLPRECLPKEEGLVTKEDAHLIMEDIRKIKKEHFSKDEKKEVKEEVKTEEEVPGSFRVVALEDSEWFNMHSFNEALDEMVRWWLKRKKKIRDRKERRAAREKVPERKFHKATDLLDFHKPQSEIPREDSHVRPPEESTKEEEEGGDQRPKTPETGV